MWSDLVEVRWICRRFGDSDGGWISLELWLAVTGGIALLLVMWHCSPNLGGCVRVGIGFPVMWLLDFVGSGKRERERSMCVCFVLYSVCLCVFSVCFMLCSVCLLFSDEKREGSC